MSNLKDAVTKALKAENAAAEEYELCSITGNLEEVREAWQKLKEAKEKTKLATEAFYAEVGYKPKDAL